MIRLQAACRLAPALIAATFAACGLLPARALADVTATTSTVTADFNRDGRPDVAFTLPAMNELAVDLGWGDGTFLAPLFTPTGTAPGELVLEDFDRDGNADLAVANSAATTVSVLPSRALRDLRAASGHATSELVKSSAKIA